MKKVILVILSMIMIMILTTFSYASSYQVKYEKYTAKLEELGIFNATELDIQCTRIEVAVLFVKLLGAEQEALDKKYEHPFIDIPVWGSDYVGYLYHEKLTKGTGANIFGSTDSIQAKSYFTFILRALGYDDTVDDFSWDTSLEFAKEQSLITDSEFQELSNCIFNKNLLAKYTYLALNMPLKDIDITIIEKLMNLNELSLKISDDDLDISNDCMFLNNELYMDADSLFELLGYSTTNYSLYLEAKKEDRILRIYENQKYYFDQDRYMISEYKTISMNKKIYVPIIYFAKIHGYDVDFLKESSRIVFTERLDDNFIERTNYFIELEGTYTVEEIENHLKYASDNFKDLTHLEVIGHSFEGRPLYAMKIGKRSNEKKPCVLLIGNIHAREDYTSMLAMKQIESILVNYYSDGKWGEYNLIDLLNKIDIWFIPLANPDGLNITQFGIEASPNYENLKHMLNVAGDYRWWKANTNGVDLNRNFDDGFWEVKNSYEKKASEDFKGEKPNSEPETIAIQNFCDDILPLMAISYHCYGEIMYWADKFTHSGFSGFDSKIVNSLSKLTGYRVMPICHDPKVFSCGFENWYRTKYNRVAICMELSPGLMTQYIQSPDEDFEELVYDKAKFVSLELASEALSYITEIYDVYYNNILLKSFYTQKDAIDYSNKIENCEVLKID